MDPRLKPAGDADVRASAVSDRLGHALVIRFRSSPALAAHSDANFGIDDHCQLYDSSAPLNPKFAVEFRGTMCVNLGFGALGNLRH
jgi:hypothetical protein